MGVEAVPLALQGSRAHNAAHCVLTNTSVKTSRTLSLPLDTTIPHSHHSIWGVFHRPAWIFIMVRVPLARSAVGLILSSPVRDVEEHRLFAGVKF